MQSPFGVSCQTESELVNSVLPSQDSMNLAVTNLLHKKRAIAGTIEKVVEILVVTWIFGSSGDGRLLDCVNLRLPNRSTASALVKVCGLFVNRTLCVFNSTATMRVEKRSLKSYIRKCQLLLGSTVIQCLLTLEKGLSSSVHLNILCDDWCILLASERSSLADCVVYAKKKGDTASQMTGS